ncbi:MAG TPA: DUF3592 domain-containing protein [Candidatus Dormibacteraeota bacterium]
MVRSQFALAIAVALVSGLGSGAVAYRLQVGWDADQTLRDQQIVSATVWTSASVIAVEPDPDDHRNPSSVHYTFSSNGNTYDGYDYSGKGGNPPYSLLRLGDEIRIAYEQNNPAASCACDPTSDLRELAGIERGFAVAIGLFASIGLVAAFLIAGRICAGAHR